MEGTQSAVFSHGMTEAEIGSEIRQAMPLPIVSILHGVKDVKRHFAVNMRIEGKSDPVFNVSWHVPPLAGRQVMLRLSKLLAHMQAAPLRN